MFRRLFGGGAKDETPAAKPGHPWELRPGDFLKFGFVAPQGLARAERQASAVHALDLGGRVRRVVALEGDGDFFLWRDDGGALALGRTIQRPVVEVLFDIDQFARLFDPDEPPNLTLQRRREPPDLAGWTAPVYRQEAACQAYRHRRDPALAPVDATLDGDAEAFDHYRLVGDRRRFAVEVAVYDGGRTDVALVAVVAESAVEELWTA